MVPRRCRAETQLQAALIDLQDEIRQIKAGCHAVDDSFCELAFRAILPAELERRMDDHEESIPTYALKFKWVDRQATRAHTRALAEGGMVRKKTLQEVTFESAPQCGEAEQSSQDPVLGALCQISPFLAAVVKVKGKGGGKNGGRPGGQPQGGRPRGPGFKGGGKGTGSGGSSGGGGQPPRFPITL